MKVLDFFCGAGGASMGYARAGFEPYGIDLFAMPNYPFPFVQGDAIRMLELLLEGAAVLFSNGELLELDDFELVVGSPPCQFFSTKTPDPSKHLDLITPFRPLLKEWGSRYVIENVVGARKALIDPVQLCGSAFGLRVRRHRLFESNVELRSPGCHHKWQNDDKVFRLYDHGRWYDSGIVHVFGTGGGKGREHWAEAMGIDWMTDAELAEAIPPAYTHYLGHQVMADLVATTSRRAA